MTPVVAITAQQAVGIFVALVVVVGWLLYFLANTRRARPEVGSEIELASNRKPYLSDEELEGPKLSRALTWGLVSLAISAVGLPLYWLAEPGRQAGAKDDFDEVFASRGEALFATTEEGGFNCAGCHGGNAGIGGEVQYTLTRDVADDDGEPVLDDEGEPETEVSQVSWKAPALNVATLKWTDEQITDILVYGRPFSPMPAWGIEGGGPMNEQQIDNLIAYLHSIEITPEEARAQAEEEARTELLRIFGLEQRLELAENDLAAAREADDEEAELAASQQVDSLEAEIDLEQPATEGAALFNLNCARCHTLGWSYDEARAPGSGAYGPPLYNVTNQFALAQDQVDFVANGAQEGEPYGLNGQSGGDMAFFGQVLSPEQIAAIVAYERTLGEETPAGEDGP